MATGGDKTDEAVTTTMSSAAVGPDFALKAESQRKTSNPPIMTSLPSLPAMPYNMPGSQPQTRLVIMPNAPVKCFTGSQDENWLTFIDHWETSMARYNYTDAQLAQILPDSLTGSAYARLKSVFIDKPRAKSSYRILKEELSKRFPNKKTMVWNIKQGNKTIADYHTAFHDAAANLWPDIDYRAKDEVLVDAFIQGLTHSYRKALLKRSPTTMEQALEIAEKEEEIKLEFNEVGTVASIEETQDRIDELERQVEYLTALLQSQDIEDYDGNDYDDEQEYEDQNQYWYDPEAEYDNEDELDPDRFQGYCGQCNVVLTDQWDPDQEDSEGIYQ